MSYVKKQLERIQPDNEIVRVQFLGAGMVKTNWLNLTPEQFKRVEELLIELKKDEG